MIALSGYVKLYRKLARWGWYKDSVVKDVFIHFLIIANYSDTPWCDRIIKRGQCIIGTKQLAEDLGFTRQQIRTAIKKLKSTNEITTETTNKYTIVTVVNWEDYQQEHENLTNETTKSLTIGQPTDNQQITNNQPQRKNNKNIKNKKNNIYAQKNCACEFFDDLWALYPRKRGKASVSKKALQEINAVGFSKMSEAIANYKADIARSNTAEQYIMYGSTFFNGGYKDWLEVHSDGPEIYSDEYMASFGIEIAGQEKPPMRRQ